jgi:hypothetical protein
MGGVVAEMTDSSALLGSGDGDALLARLRRDGYMCVRRARRTAVFCARIHSLRVCAADSCVVCWAWTTLWRLASS